MLIQFWQQPNFSVPYGTLVVLRTDPEGLVAYSWVFPDSQNEEAQDWIRPQMLPSPESQPIPEPEPKPVFYSESELNDKLDAIIDPGARFFLEQLRPQFGRMPKP